MSEPIAVTDITGTTTTVDCLACAIVARDIVPTGALPVSTYFDAHQDYEIPIPGFIILASKRHIQSVEEFTEEEQQDFMQYLSRIRKAMRDALGIEHVTLIQDEDTRHHFHLWLFPRYPWMDAHGRKIESVRPIMEYAKKHMKTDTDLQKIKEATQKLRAALPH